MIKEVTSKMSAMAGVPHVVLRDRARSPLLLRNIVFLFVVVSCLHRSSATTTTPVTPPYYGIEGHVRSGCFTRTMLQNFLDEAALVRRMLKQECDERLEQHANGHKNPYPGEAGLFLERYFANSVIQHEGRATKDYRHRTTPDFSSGTTGSSNHGANEDRRREEEGPHTNNDGIMNLLFDFHRSDRGTRQHNYGFLYDLMFLSP
ncbi:unnamed protein product, partial [Amoebophrya sp. A120]|eukprot:GSA120T00004342001.1